MAIDIAVLTKMLAITVGTIFGFAGIAKLPNLKAFKILVKSYGVMPVWMSDISSTMLPFIEILLGLALIIPPRLPYQLEVASILVVFFQIIFLAFLFYGLYKNKVLDNCGCFGVAIPVKLDSNKIIIYFSFLIL